MVKFAMLSREGSRDNNEDNVGMYQDGESFCFILADGLGGHGKGEVASQVAVEAVIGKFAAGGRTEDFLDEAFCAAQEAIVEKQESDRTCKDMKTTLVVLLVEPAEVRWDISGTPGFIFFRMGSSAAGLWTTAFRRCWSL